MQDVFHTQHLSIRQDYACHDSFSYDSAHSGYVALHISMTKIKGEPAENTLLHGYVPSQPLAKADEHHSPSDSYKRLIDRLLSMNFN